MFAHVPTVPGKVQALSDYLPSDETAKEWEHCGDIVKEGWNFDGYAFTPPSIESVLAPTAQQLLQTEAQAALSKSDIVILRCFESNVSVPSAWLSYRNTLRGIAKGSDTTSKSLPPLPDYPAGS